MKTVPKTCLTQFSLLNFKMKKIIGKKQQGQLNLRQLKRVTDAIPDSSKLEFKERKNQVTERKKKSSQFRSVDQGRASQSDEPKVDLRLNSPHPSRPDSISFDQDESVYSSENFSDYSNKREKSFSEIGEPEDVFERDSRTCQSGVFSRENSVNFLRSEESLKCNENLVFKQASEEADFSASNCDFTKEDDVQYPAEILRLTDPGKSRSDFLRRSEVCYNESLFNEITVMDSQENKFIKQERSLPSYVPYQRCKKMLRGLNKFIVRKKKQIRAQKVMRKSSFLKETIIPAYYVEEEKKEKNISKTKSPQKQENEKNFFLEEDIDEEAAREEDLETKQYILDCFTYIIYLICITTIALSMMSTDMYYFTDMTTSLFLDLKSKIPSNSSMSSNKQEKTLRESRTFEDFWAYAESTLIQLLYWDFIYSQMDPKTHGAENDKKMFFENQILGVARLRQVRVRNNSCEIHSYVKRFFENCFFYYSVFAEETRPIKEGMENSSAPTAWVYTEAKTLGTSYYWGEISTYGGGGYYLDLAPTKEESLQMIKELKENFWLSRATRAVFIDFNIYNANVNLFCLCKIVLEFPPVGGMIPKTDFQSLKLIRYLTVFDFFILGCEFIYVLFVAYFTWKLVATIIKEKVSFFFSFWNFVEIFILILSYAYIILSIVRYFYAFRLISTLDYRYFKYTEFQSLKDTQITFNNIIAILVFISWMKLFYYFTFSTLMFQYRKTLARSFKDTMAFLPMFFSIFLAFAFLAHLIFGNQLKDYRTIRHSFMTLLQAFLGEFNYFEIANAHQVFGPIFYTTFVFFIFLILMNIFIAIICDAYIAVKSQVIPNNFKTSQYIRRGLINICTCFRPARLKKSILKDMRKKILFQEITDALKSAGFSTTEIKIFFYKYSINLDNFLSQKTRQRILDDLELHPIDLTESSKQVQINTLRRRIDYLRDQMDNMATNLQPIADKIDILLQRL